jgi:eukaryotic-like serine/threonine-protein kinase
LAADGALRERFLREAQSAAALNHPNICTVYEIDEEHSLIAMECIEGPSLKQKITRSRST